jgi:hypothetical protein
MHTPVVGIGNEMQQEMTTQIYKTLCLMFPGSSPPLLMAQADISFRYNDELAQIVFKAEAA